MAVKLKTRGIEGFSLRAKELMEDSLELRGEFTLAVTYMSREIAQKIAIINNLSLDYKRILWKGKPEEYYLFRVDHQQKFRGEQKERRKWKFIRNLGLASILAFLTGLFIQVFSGAK